MKNISFNRKNIYKQAWNDTKKHFFMLIGMGVVAIIIYMVAMGIAAEVAPEAVAQIIGALALSFFMITLTKVNLSVVDGENIKFDDMFKNIKSWKHYFRFFFGNILVQLILGIIGALVVFATIAATFGIGGFSLLAAASSISTISTAQVIGSILVFLVGIAIYAAIAIALYYTQYYLAENRLSIGGALSQSRKITKGKRFAIFKFHFMLALFNILGVMTVIGWIFTVPFTFLAHARLYRQLDGIPVHETNKDDGEEKNDDEQIIALQSEE